VIYLVYYKYKIIKVVVVVVSLKYVENPFTDDYLASFYYFQEEKAFYDCLIDEFLLSDEVFRNLDGSFYTYLLTGDSGEWIGYVLLYNHELVNGYLEVVQLELERLLLKLKNIVVNDNIDRLLNDLRNGVFSSTSNLSLLREELSLLKVTLGCDKVNTYFDDYDNNVLDYLASFKEHYYLDIVVGLPLGTRRDEVKLDYLDFINEAFKLVDEIIIDKFSNIPIFKSNKELYTDYQKVKKIDKDIA